MQMATFEIAVYVTNELWNYGRNNHNNGYEARDRAKTYIEGALGRHGHSVDFVDTTGYRPTVYTQKYSTGFKTDCVGCETETECYYTHLLDWFQDWVRCGRPSGSDSTILLTKTDSANGGNAYPGKFAVATTGKFVCDLPTTYEHGGWSSAHNGMNTILHEIGHNLMGSGTGDEDNDGVGEHDVATLKSDVDWYNITAMKVNGDTNDCGESTDQDPVGWENTWSNCCVSNWAKLQ